jgi:hypothetical protein
MRGENTHCHLWGYVFWDMSRLENSGILQQGPDEVPIVDDLAEDEVALALDERR